MGMWERNRNVQSSEPVTLKTLAHELGLNVSTVSRVLNDPLGPGSRWASQKTNEKIFALARDKGYSRNPYAASLRTAKSNMVGVIVPRLQDYVLATIYEGIDEAATAHGLFTVVANSLDVAANQRVKAEMLLDRRADGLIFGDAHLNEPYLDELKKRGTPYTLVSRSSEGHISVTCDDHAGGRLIAEHFIATGRGTFGVIAGDSNTSTSRDRTAGFLAALGENGIAVPDEWIIHGGFDATAGQMAAKQILQSRQIPEGIFAVNDFAAIGALGVLQKVGMRLPDDIALAGYNDTPLAEAVNLTSVRSPLHEMGSLGLETVLGLMAGHDVDSRKLEPTLVVRASG